MVWSFSSGPSTLPPEILAEARGVFEGHPSLAEQPFTSDAVTAVMLDAEAALRALLGLSADHHVLFLQGGAYAHFAMLPTNLLGAHPRAEYVDAGLWSGRAIEEARRGCAVAVVTSGAACGYRALPPRETWVHDPEAGYCHLVSNETANGLCLPEMPNTGSVPLVADMSSDLLLRDVDPSRFGLIYASAQKNLGIAGLTVLVVRDDMLDRARPETPAVFDYGRQARARSRVNTPPVVAVALAGMVFRRFLREGGVAAAARRSAERSRRLYAALAGGFYRCPVEAAWRSPVNVVFGLSDAALEARLLAEAEGAGLLNLRGHPKVGGLRASLYDAMPMAGVEALAEFLRDFERARG